jgi:Protein of unknown function with PCYCGC motif
MTNRFTIGLLGAPLFAAACLLVFAPQVPSSSLREPPPATSPSDAGRKSGALAQGGHAFHKAPPGGPLPATLDAAHFENNKPAFVAYSIAAKIPKLLYQVPCYCGCDKVEGHRSLLDCYVGKHGVACPPCQKGAIVTYELSKAGKTPAEIRESMEKGDVWKFDLDQYVETHYPEHKQAAP